MELLAASEGMPATYEINGRQFIVVPVAAGAGLFAARFGGSFDSPRGALAQDRPSPVGGRGAVDGLPGQYIALALKR
jgi:hypothetical protein